MKKRRQGKEREKNQRLEVREGREKRTKGEEDRRREEKKRDEMIQKMHARGIGKPRSCVFSILCPRIPSAKDLEYLNDIRDRS